MYLFFAPAFFTSSLLILPKPDLGDGERLESRLSLNRALDGTTYTHVVSQPNRVYRWSFDLTRYKGVEFWGFYHRWHSETIRILELQSPTDFTVVNTYIGNFKINPITLEMYERKLLADSSDAVRLELEFETTQ